MGKREGEQESLFVTPEQLRSQSHLFYRAVNRVLGDHGFDRDVEKLCAKFYANKMGRPGLAPGVYFRSLLLGLVERIDSERGSCGRAIRIDIGKPCSRRLRGQPRPLVGPCDRARHPRGSRPVPFRGPAVVPGTSC
jgi:hypothetical protein